MKNILAENLLRFGVKNLKESDKEKIAEALLTEQIQQVATAIDALNTQMSAKRTKIGEHQIYPAVSIVYGAKMPNPGQSLTPAMIPQGLNTSPSIETKFINASEILSGKPLPVSINVYLKKIQGASRDDQFGKFINTLPNGPKIKLWGAAGGVAVTNAPKLSDVKEQIINYCKNFYITGTNGKFWNTNGVNAVVTGNTDNYSTQLDSLLKSLSAIWINTENNVSGKQQIKLWCINPA